MQQTTKVKDVMTAHPILVNPSITLQEAAKKMEEADCGMLPVGSEEKLEGIITDRDITIRAISKGKNPAQEKISDYMTKGEIYACNENATLQEAADIMHAHKISRLIVKNENDKVAGVLTFGAILRKDKDISEVADVVKHAVGK
ncbi:MAG: CBS domain-containing protein [Burkholderiales bacterium]